jgi:hypothetical protein
MSDPLSQRKGEFTLNGKGRSLFLNGKLDAVATHADFQGQAYRLTKLSPVEDGEEATYHVLLSRQGHACECQGFLRYDRCKHVEGLLALVQAGKL